jgi:glycosyltransferase involved in cell wall biosynthesis
MLLSKQYFGDTRVNRECESLAGAEYSTTVLAWDRDKSHRAEDLGPSIRVELIGPACKRRSFFSFIVKLPIFWKDCLSAARKEEVAIVHSHDFDTLPVGYVMSRLKGVPLVYDSHESYADMIAQDAPSIIVKIVRGLEKRMMRRADVIFVANENVAKLIGAEQSVVLLNCPAESEVPISCSPNKVKTEGGLKRLGYFGSLEPGRFISESIRAVSKAGGWQIVLGGEGTLAGDVKDAAQGSQTVTYLGHIPHNEVMEQSSKCDALHVMLDPSNVNYRISTPLRLFEAMSLGIPSIVSKGICPAGIVEKEGCGFICDFDEEAFSQLLIRLSNSSQEIIEKGRRGQEAFHREYNWEKQAVKLLLAYSELLGAWKTGAPARGEPRQTE